MKYITVNVTIYFNGTTTTAMTTVATTVGTTTTSTDRTVDMKKETEKDYYELMKFYSNLDEKCDCG